MCPEFSLLSSSGNIFSAAEREELARRGAVGDICFRFINSDGAAVPSPLMDRVIGIDLGLLRRTQRVVGIAGGAQKVPAILAALRGRWISVLITDRLTAQRLLSNDRTAKLES